MKNCIKIENTHSTRIVLSLLRIFLPISVCFVAVWTGEKFDFIATQIFEGSEYPFGRVHLFRQMFPLKFTPRKLRAEKVSAVAEEVSPQNSAQNRDAELWDRQTLGYRDRLMEASRQCGLAKSNRNCDQFSERNFPVQMELRAFNWQLRNLRHW